MKNKSAKMSSLAPAVEVQLNFLAMYPSIKSDTHIQKNKAIRLKIFCCPCLNCSKIFDTNKMDIIILSTVIPLGINLTIFFTLS